MKKTLIVTALIWLLCPVAAQAELTLSLGYATGTSPYKSYDSQHVFLPLINFESDLFYLRALEAGVKVYENEYFQVSAFAAYDPSKFDPSDSSDHQLRRLDKRRAGVLAGGRVSFNSEIGKFSASLAADVSGHSQGLVSRLDYQRVFDLNGRLTLIPQAGFYWRSEKYYDYYYGVSRREAARSGLEAYEADSGFSPFVGLAANLALDEEARWKIFGRGEVAFLPDAVQDSPMVDRSHTFGFSTGVSYTFK